MKLVRSNRTEPLVEALIASLRSEPLGPLDAEVIVVQSRGTEQWLTLELAKRLGVWSHPEFPFPRLVIERVLGAFGLGPTEQSRAYEPAQLQWTVADLIRTDAPDSLHGFLGEAVDDDRALRLAGRLALVFDDYLVYRPDMLRHWSIGASDEAGAWQAELWRRVVARLGPHDLPTRMTQALAPLSDASDDRDLGFERLHLFSIETLPPVFLSFFSALGQRVPTNLYVLSPCAGAVSSSETDASGQLSLPIASSRGADTHRLVAFLGGLCRDFEGLLSRCDGLASDTEERFAVPTRNTLLGALQADMLESRPKPAADERSSVALGDDSITIHACASAMREVQVVHDQVRQALERDRTLQPEDVLVVTPDLEMHAPAFRAVFGQGSEPRIPFEVHDRRARDDARFLDDFLGVLDVLASRFSVLDVVRLMDAKSWREELCFSPSERSRLADLLATAGVRWGVDGAHRRELGFPAEGLHTWHAGLGRLFLGFASMPDSHEPFAGLLPRGSASLADAELVARLSRLCAILFEFRIRTAGARAVADWATLLGELSSALFAEEDDATGAVRVLRAALEALRETARQHRYSAAISLRTVREKVGELVLQRTPATGFLRRGVTLSELVPLRSVPFRMVCLLGMSEETFPRSDNRLRFDLMRVRAAPGDRNRREDDKHSFFQAVASARDRLVITYSAPVTSARSVAVPSPVVWELSETLNAYYRREGRPSVLEPFDHPVHPFDRSYFEPDGTPSSFSQRHLAIAQALSQPPSKPATAKLEAEAPSRVESLSIQELARWIWHPARQFIRVRLRTRLEESILYEPASALTELGTLDAFIVGNEALSRGLRGEALRAFLAAAPEFPDGNWGTADQEAIASEVEVLLNARANTVHGTPLDAGLVGVELGGLRLEGHLDGLFADKRIKVRFNRAESKTELTAWLEHLLMQAADERGLPSATEMWLRSDASEAKCVRFSPVREPRAVLAELVSLYDASQARPIELLPRASWRFARGVHEGKKATTPTMGQTGKGHHWFDRYVDYAWGPGNPFDDDAWSARFKEVSSRVYGPLFEHRSAR